MHASTYRIRYGDLVCCLSSFPQSRHGNRFGLVALHHPTKWVEAYAVRITPAEQVAQFPAVTESAVPSFACRYHRSRNLSETEVLHSKSSK